MSKVIKNLCLNVISENGSTVTRNVVSYEVASSTDETLKKSNTIEITFTGDNVTKLQDLFAACIAEVNTTEGIT